MMTVKQVSSLTGVSVRTLQFYDEIGLLRPTKVTDAGYRLYDEAALEVLQQILFFKELDFPLKKIKAVMEDPQFDRMAAFQKQRALLQMKRDRLDGLLELLDKLIKGENCMEFQKFDMSEYFRVLADFQRTHTDEIVKRLGSMECFDEMVADLKAREDEIAAQAVKQYGSLENYTRAMEKSLGDFLANGPAIPQPEVGGLIDKTEALTRKLTADLSKDAASPEIQETVGELVAFVDECNKGIDMGQNYWQTMADMYLTSAPFMEGTDKKYGAGAAHFLGMALKAYLEQHGAKNA